MGWPFVRAVTPFFLAWKKTRGFEPDPQNYAYDAYGQVPHGYAGAGYSVTGQMEIVSGGAYQNQHTVLVGMPSQFEGVVNQPLGNPEPLQ